MKDTFLVKKPWITEKATDLSALGKYVFMVKPTATKNEVKKAIETLYKVHVTDVNMINRPRKKKRFGVRFSEQEKVRKAIVTLKSGEKIDVQ